ncbi:MAG: hypothetical protein JWP81_3969 [Ferruginibacter sp.]|nr:hypothetical protein [Ferruginibacter sp.]
MRTFLSIVTLFILAPACYGQGLSVDNLFSVISLSPSKCENQLSAKGFSLKLKELQNDTLLRVYDYTGTKHLKVVDSISRCVSRTDTKENCYLTYETASSHEFKEMIAALKAAGFYCKKQDKGDNLSGLLFQNKDLSVSTNITATDTINRYTLQFHKRMFPRKKDIYYANDLLSFTSHEYLVYYFGEENVKTDAYVVGKDHTVKCSVLFANTNRQVVFIWADDVNLCGISGLLFGGQLNLKSSSQLGKYVEENNWSLKSGIRPGMSLEELRLRNGNDFRFYGGNSANTGLVIPTGDGKLDFKKEEIVLGCLNCRDDKFNTARVVNADDSIEEGRVLFILSVMLNPQ